MHNYLGENHSFLHNQSSGKAEGIILTDVSLCDAPLGTSAADSASRNTFVAFSLAYRMIKGELAGSAAINKAFNAGRVKVDTPSTPTHRGTPAITSPAMEFISISLFKSAERTHVRFKAGGPHEEDIRSHTVLSP
uniref:Uncharacterized protein n=1 Tax=Anguilla anguilla TaxID=7936 RepID=A0A0E9WB78_ANGAN